MVGKNIGETELKESMNSLTKSINNLNGLLKEAGEGIKQEEATDKEILNKLDVLIKHNEEMAKGILLLLELSREHLPRISKHAREELQRITRPLSKDLPPLKPSKPSPPKRQIPGF